MQIIFRYSTVLIIDSLFQLYLTCWGVLMPVRHTRFPVMFLLTALQQCLTSICRDLCKRKSFSWTIVCFENMFLNRHQLPSLRSAAGHTKQRKRLFSPSGVRLRWASVASPFGASPPSSTYAAQTEPFLHTRALTRQD